MDHYATGEIKISVVIPIYKVENYLHQCVDSVLQQTYQNIEIILVDDGSPDHCPQICDDYANSDSRIKVIHKVNGGLSDARNEGMKEVTGNYILFLDSDDYWEDADALSLLTSRIMETHADVINYPYIKFYEKDNKRVCNYQAETMPTGLALDAQIEYLMTNSLYIASACNKLIRSELIKTEPFEVGVESEDISWCAKLLTKAQALDYINLPFYIYRQQRSGSITNGKTAKSCMDISEHIVKCLIMAGKGSKLLQPYLYIYTAYQYSTFIAVQALATECPAECYRKLQPYSWVLRYHVGNKKVQVMNIGCKIFGLKGFCKLIKLTKNIWNKAREK